jgi:hypothetical protein
MTYLYQPASAPGASDGVVRLWIDATKIVDVSAAAAGIVPPGGTAPWCTASQVQQLDTAPVGEMDLGEYLNGGDGSDFPMALVFLPAQQAIRVEQESVAGS